MQTQSGASPAPLAETGQFSPKDRSRLGLSVWLLILLRTWNQPPDIYVRSGQSISACELAAAMDIGERQARRELQRLRRAGYVELQNTGRGYRIRVLDPSGRSTGPR
jgi:DNA-binding transcriptional ArsR family regulator